MLSYEAEIIRALREFGSGKTKNPDAKHNVGNMLGEYFMWDTIGKFAEARKDAAYEKMQETGIFKAPEAPGNYELANSPHFTLSVVVTQPVKRFDADALAKAMVKSKYKVPEPFMKEQVEAAKVPTKPMVRKTVKESA